MKLAEKGMYTENEFLEEEDPTTIEISENNNGQNKKTGLVEEKENGTFIVHEGSIIEANFQSEDIFSSGDLYKKKEKNIGVNLIF